MTSLKDTLKILNKDVAEEDQFKITSDKDRDIYDIEFISFGSPMLDHIAGGIGLGRTTELVGWGGSGKSTLALLGAAELQKKKGQYVVYFDGEYTVDNSYMDRLGINRELFIHIPGHNLEYMLDVAEEFSKTDEIGMIIIDSIKSFTSKVVEDKSAEDNTIGIEAKKLNARIPIIAGNCARRKKALVVLNQLRLNPGEMFGNPEVLPGGHWQDFIPSLILYLRKGTKAYIEDVNKNIVGHTMMVKVYKSKYKGIKKQDTFEVDLYYDSGFDVYKDYANVFIDSGIIKKMGAWYLIELEGKEPMKLQGITKVADLLENDPDILLQLEKIYNDAKR